MGYLDRLLNCMFKKDGAGRTVFFPSGAAGKGRILEGAGLETALRTFLRRYYLSAFLAVIGMALLTGSVYGVLLLFLALHVWSHFRTRKLLAHSPVSDEKLTFREIYTALAAAHNKLVLWVILAASLLYCAAGVWTAFSAAGAGQRSLGIAAALAFGISSAALAYMISVNRDGA